MVGGEMNHPTRALKKRKIVSEELTHVPEVCQKGQKLCTVH